MPGCSASMRMARTKLKSRRRGDDSIRPVMTSTTDTWSLEPTFFDNEALLDDFFFAGETCATLVERARFENFVD